MDFDVASDEPVSMAVVRAVSTVDGTDPCSLPPLANRLDPDALDVLFEPGAEGSPRTGGQVSFVYGDYRVTVDNGEYLTVRGLDSPQGGASAHSQSESA